MKKYLITFLLGIIVGTGGYWAFRDGPLAKKMAEQPTIAKALGAVQGKLEERSANEVKEEMVKNGQVVMTKPNSKPIADDLLKDLVKAQLAADPLTSQANIKTSVLQGKVELTGTATSYEQVSRALRLVLESDAVNTVVSKIEVKAQ
jgi:osmotically-inducible protein OsmY